MKYRQKIMTNKKYMVMIIISEMMMMMMILIYSISPISSKR